ncbi:L,D-transpeptidase family protein [uncultured Flavobacterium sp.]|uniref:L,D-transpeptidase family protein n=1 Tax=uncultured Flavobacterium sp. TaxID=165435 RepID=UPI0025E83CAA|nr:L,D-transpeptidase family protein [uncultured Flavobacterium sp.]
MRNAATILLALIFLFPACKNARKENFPEKAVNTAYLKDTPLSINARLLEKSPGSVTEFYASYGMKTVWTNQENRRALIAAVQDAGSDGLLPSDYYLNTLEQFEALTIISKEECMRYDILLTESFTQLATHLFKGRLLPRNVYHDWALAPKKIDTNKLLAEVLVKNNAGEVIARCRPKHATYNGLRKSLAYLEKLPDDKGLGRIEIKKALKPGDSGAVVTQAKLRLAYWGDLMAEDAKNALYDKATIKAVKKFQERHGLAQTGVIDARTATTLNISRNDRKNQVIANLERWRWFPYDFGKRAIIINIPTYALAVVENNKDTIDTYNVVVGKPDRRTPVLYSAINQLTINPTWTIPPTYLKKDLVPAARKDTMHFSNLNMKILYKNEEIPVSEWDSLKADHYVYVQSPGSHNSLGRIKFNFKNGFYVYLHDTNHREYFKKGYRALSSGCVRVEDPFRLAEYVLEGDSRWDRKKLDEMVTQGETQHLGLKKTTPIHQLYWTAWMDRDGLQFRNDIYNLDKALYEKLRKQP